MNKIKRILAFVGIIIILALYVTSFVLAIFGNENTFQLFKISFIATVVVPVLIWIYTFIGKLLQNHYSPESYRKRYEMEEAIRKAKEEANKNAEESTDEPHEKSDC